jgi:hypothetical protein
MSFYNVTVTDYNILTWGVQSPGILVASGFNDNCIISLIKLTIFYQEVPAHFQIDTIVIVSVGIYIQITNNTAIAHIQMYGPKGAFTNLELIEQDVLTSVEVYQVRTKIIFSFRHLPFFYRNIR